MTRLVPILCPVKDCGKPMVKVIRSEPWQGGIRRRRKCEAGHRLTTVERPLRPAA